MVKPSTTKALIKIQKKEDLASKFSKFFKFSKFSKPETVNGRFELQDPNNII